MDVHLTFSENPLGRWRNHQTASNHSQQNVYSLRFLYFQGKIFYSSSFSFFDVFFFEKFLSSSIPLDHLTKHDNWEGLRKASPKHILVGIQMMLYCCCWPTNGEQCRLKTVNRETKKPNKKKSSRRKKAKTNNPLACHRGCSAPAWHELFNVSCFRCGLWEIGSEYFRDSLSSFAICGDFASFYCHLARESELTSGSETDLATRLNANFRLLLMTKMFKKYFF